VVRAEAPPQGSSALDMTGVRLVGLPDFYGPIQYFWKMGECRAIAQKVLTSVESILLRAPGTISNLVWSFVRNTDRPVGMEVLGDPRSSFERGASRHPLRRWAGWYYASKLREQCAQAYATAYVSERSVQKLYPPNAERFTTHYSSVELPQNYLVPRARTEFSSQGPYRLVMIGSFATMYKAHDIMLNALAELQKQGRQIHTTFIGDGKHLVEMRQMASNLGLEEHVSFLGAIPSGPPVLAELDKADLFVIPSRTEGIPRALIEAMARALPCIGTNVGGLPELLDPEEMMPANDSHALAKKIVDVLGDPPRMARLSKRNLEIAARYRQEVLIARRNAFYQHLRDGTDAWFRQHANSRDHSSATVGAT
jgi:glycosyltransferase involved in cell wall biosynthesis